MARGDLVLFEEFALQIGQEKHNFPSDTLKAGIVDATITPTAADATPTWGDYSANEVGTGGGYTANGMTLAGVAYSEAGGVATLDANDLALIQDASGFTDGFWLILYNDTNATDMAMGFVDLGGPVSEVAGPIDVAWNASGIATVTVTP
ncbi:MAG: hypothetical protein DRH26_03465 [Deltaproteobacteria bacterium]|nr:MAG: hypothetical protein DRH26_03465 [Deltaproteobacteria bacterium]